MKEPPRQSDINLLDPGFKQKFDLWRSEVLKRYPNARVFESKRSKERQERLYAQGRTRPGKIVTNIKHIGMHGQGKAVDIVFLNNQNQPTRSGPYDDLIALAKQFNIKNLKPFETCHFEDNGKPLSLPQTIMLVFEVGEEVEVRDEEDGIRQPRIYLCTVPGNTRYPHIVVDGRFIEEYSKGKIFLNEDFKYIRKIQPKPEPKKMTMEELNKELGYEVEIVEKK